MMQSVESPNFLKLDIDYPIITPARFSVERANKTLSFFLASLVTNPIECADIVLSNKSTNLNQTQVLHLPWNAKGGG